MLAKRVRDAFPVNDTIVTAIPETAFTDGTSQQRYKRWRQQSGLSNERALEYLVPRIELDVTRSWPDSMTPRRDVSVLGRIRSGSG